MRRIRRAVWFHRISAAGWVFAGVAAFRFGWQTSVAFVVVASVYANVKSDWGAAEAADDRAVIERLDRIERLLRQRAVSRPGLRRR